jgi:hypothetical protein
LKPNKKSNISNQTLSSVYKVLSSQHALDAARLVVRFASRGRLQKVTRHGRDRKNERAAHFAGTVEEGAILAGPGVRLVTLAQVGVLDGILDVVIVRQVPGDLVEEESDEG